MERSVAKQQVVLQNILMASLVSTRDGLDCLYNIQTPSATRQLQLPQRPGVSEGNTCSRTLERVSALRQAYRASGCKVLAKASTIDFIGPYLMGKPRPIISSSKSPVSTYPAKDILTSYNESRDRLMAESRLPACGPDNVAGNIERPTKQTDAAQTPSGIHYRHKDKEKTERYSRSSTENMVPVNCTDENFTPTSVKPRNQFKPNGLRTSAPSGTFQDGSISTSSSALPKQLISYANPLMVSGISQVQAGRDIEDEPPMEDRELASDQSLAVWQPAVAATAVASASSPSSGRAPLQTGPAAAGGQLPRRSLSKGGSTTWRSQSHSSGGSGSLSGSSGRPNKKEVEPVYADPLMGAPTSLQSRLAELATLESETVRWEKARKLKKKCKDRDD